MLIRRLFPLLLAAAAAAFPVAAAAQTDAAALLSMRELDRQVATIGHRMAVAARDLCVRRQGQYGFAVHDLSQYGAAHRPAAIRAFGLDRGPAVLALAQGGPAEAAGLKADDVLVAIGGVAIDPPAPTDRRGAFAPVEQLLDRLEAAFDAGPVTLDLLRGGAPVQVTVTPEPGCATRFQLIPARALNAKADGVYVQLTSAIAQYVADEDELAAVIAHEFAHNILHHRDRLRAAGVVGSLGRQLGRSARLVRESEIEADRLSVHLMAQAGYDPDAAARFWRRFGPRGLAFLGSPTHPNWRSRVASLEAEAEAIRAARAEGRPAPLPVALPRD
jgi:beta-barrel assembly-enhancing protease